MREHLASVWGISGSFAVQAALLYAYLWFYGLEPRITSGFRDPSHQKELQAKWDMGDRQGLKVRPATDSLHSRINGTGSPAALAIDIATKDNQMAGQIAHALDIGWGGDFAGQSNYDPVHFYDKKGSNGL